MNIALLLLLIYYKCKPFLIFKRKECIIKQITNSLLMIQENHEQRKKAKEKIKGKI